MRVNIVTERGDWILNRCARELAERIPGVTVNGTGEVTYYLPAYSWCKPAQIRPGSIGFWTHPTEARLDAYHDRFVANVAMNETVAAQLAKRGAHVTVIRPGVSVPTRRITFGVVGRTYASKRKGEDKIAALVGDGHSVIARGEGWPCPARPLVLDELPEFYRSIDYLLVTSTEEGGPMPVLDAIAQGVPVIAPNVGWCWEFPCIGYDGSLSDLRRVVTALTNPPTWEQWASDHARLFAEIAERAA